MLLHADGEACDQTGQMPRLIGVFAGCTCHLVGIVMLRLKYQILFNLAVKSKICVTLCQ